jgi:hypothetical protein
VDFPENGRGVRRVRLSDASGIKCLRLLLSHRVILSGQGEQKVSQFAWRSPAVGLPLARRAGAGAGVGAPSGPVRLRPAPDSGDQQDLAGGEPVLQIGVRLRCAGKRVACPDPHLEAAVRGGREDLT